MASDNGDQSNIRETQRKLVEAEAAEKAQRAIFWDTLATAYKNPEKVLPRLQDHIQRFGLERAKALTRGEDDSSRSWTLGALRGGILAPMQRKIAQDAANRLADEMDKLYRIETDINALKQQIAEMRQKTLSMAPPDPLAEAQQKIYAEARELKREEVKSKGLKKKGPKLKP